MKAAVYKKFGGPEVINIVEVDKPSIKPDEMLVKVAYSGITIGDARLRGSNFPAGFKILGRLGIGIFAPRKKILGNTFSGTVEEVGSEVTEFQKGDEVLGIISSTMGAHAEFVKVKTKQAVVKKPKSISFEDAAAVTFGGTTGLYFANQVAKIQKDQKVLINGASGAVGTNLVQLAKLKNATVVAVCSGKNSELVKSLGADRVIDYKTENVYEDTEKYDYVIDLVGNLDISSTKKLLTPNGKIVLVVASFGATLKAMLGLDKKLIAGIAPEKKDDLESLVKLLQERKLKVVIDKIFPFEKIVEAHQRVDSGHKVGNVLVKIS